MLNTIPRASENVTRERFSALRHVTPEDLVREGVVRWTSVEAGIVLAACRYDRQSRDLNKAGRQHMAVLSDMMVRGQWRAKDALDFARLDGRLILVNGHHRLGAQAEAGTTIEWMVAIHQCSSEAEVANLFHKFDTNVRTRGNHLILGVADAHGLLGVSKSTAEALYRAAPLLLSNFDFSRTSRDPVMTRVIDRRLELMKAFQNEAKAWEAATSEAGTLLGRRLANQGAMAVALMAFRHQPTLADEFWGGSARNDGLRKGDPRHTYIAAVGGGYTGTQGRGTSELQARLAGGAWNAWIEGRALTYLRPTMGGPFRLLGTPVGR